MKFNENTLNKFIDKALLINETGVTYKEILEGEAGVKRKTKDYQPYYLKYAWTSREKQEKWIKWIEQEVRKISPSSSDSDVEADVNFVDMLCSLSEVKLLEKEQLEKEDDF